MNTFCSKLYKKLEFFAKGQEEDGKVFLTDEKGNTQELTMVHPYYNWFQLPLRENETYELKAYHAAISIAYLSEHPKILETGICCLEVGNGVEMLEGEKLAEFYDTPIREQYHFSPVKNWLNDPNGLCWYQGYYHLFYQANPHGQEWNNMYWGHAASKDLIHWVHLPFVLEPQTEILERYQEIKGGAFSGSAWALENKVLFYLTRHIGPLKDGEDTIQYQTMAESEDMIHLKKEHTIIYDKPEGVNFDFRDPKVTRIDRRYYMVIGANKDGVPSILLYCSEDGYHWSYVKPLLTEREPQVTTFECPDLFLLDGKYVAVGAWMNHYDEYGRFQMTRYYIGTLENDELRIENTGWVDFGSNFYAVQSLEHKGRRIAIGWISDFYGEHVSLPNGAYGSFSLPRELHIRNNRLYMEPIPETYQLLDQVVYQGRDQDVFFRMPGNTYYAKLNFCKDTDFEIVLGKTEKSKVVLRKENKVTEIVTEGVKSERIRFVADVEEVQQIEIFVDRRLIEVFLNHGEAAGAKLFYNESDNGMIHCSIDGKEAVQSIQIYTMKKIW